MKCPFESVGIAILATAAASSAQSITWTHQAPLPTPWDVNDIQMLSATEAFAVADQLIGDGAAILHTTDGGVTWDSTIPATNSIETVTFVDPQHGWAAGNGFFHTVDGGQTWIQDNQWGSIYDIFFLDTQNGWACGNGGVTYRTTDGGLNWSWTAVGSITTMASIFFQDPQHGWAVNIAGNVYESTDGGVTWSLDWASGVYLNTILFFDDLNGWAIGGNSFFRTSDGGGSWQQQPVPFGTWVYSVSWSDPLHGWGLGPGSVRTTDGGQTWLQMPEATSFHDLLAIDFADPLNGMFGGATGILQSSEDGGVTWSSLSSGGAGFTHGLDAVDALHAWAANDGGEVLYTTDGGAHWERSYVPGFSTYGWLEDVDFLDTQTGWAGGANSTFATGDGGKVVKSVDGGKTWTVQLSKGSVVHAVEVVDASTVYVVGETYSSSGWTMKSVNGGQTWTDVSPGAFQNDVDFIDANVGWSVGGGVYKTTNGGQTWVSQHDVGGSCCYVYSVSMADAMNGWFCGWDGVYHTKSGGATWTKQVTPGAEGPLFPLFDIQALSPTTAWVVGDDGYCARTTDAGATWVQEDFIAGFQYSLEAAHFLDPDFGWVGGANIFPQGGIWQRSGAGEYVCAADLGFDGHGMLAIGMCGSPLATGGSATFSAVNGPQDKPLFVALSTLYNPTYVEMFKWTIVPYPPQQIFNAMLDGAGTFSLEVPGGGGPLTMYVQAVALSPLDYSGFTTSNALQVEFLP